MATHGFDDNIESKLHPGFFQNDSHTMKNRFRVRFDPMMSTVTHSSVFEWTTPENPVVDEQEMNNQVYKKICVSKWFNFLKSNVWPKRTKASTAKEAVIWLSGMFAT